MLFVACFSAGGAVMGLLVLGRNVLPAAEITRLGVIFVILSAAFFLSPSALIFLLAVAVVCSLYISKVSYSVLFFVIMLGLPSLSMKFLQIPGINYVFDLSTGFIISVFGIIVAVSGKSRERDFRTAGILLIFMLLFFSVSVMNRTTFTNDLRTVVTEWIIICGPFFGITSTLKSREDLVQTIVTLFVMAAIMASIAIVGQTLRWNLYADQARDMFQTFIRYKSRGALVRMNSTFGNAYINFGIVLAGLTIMSLPIINRFRTVAIRVMVVAGLIVGFLMSASRTPFAASAIGFVAMTMSGRNAVPRLILGVLAAFVLILLLQLTPFGGGLLAYLPFVGEQGTDNYRVLLLKRSLDIIWDAPIFGDHQYQNKMEELRQGEGIIDIVNAYLGAALPHGIPYMVFYVLILVLPCFAALKLSKKLREHDKELSLIGLSLIGGMAVIVSGFAATSMTTQSKIITIGLAALVVSYNRIAKKTLSEQQSVSQQTEAMSPRKLARA
jgi:hypothetical protein